MRGGSENSYRILAAREFYMKNKTLPKKESIPKLNYVMECYSDSEDESLDLNILGSKSCDKFKLTKKMSQESRHQTVSPTKKKKTV